ncbi:MAG: phage tail protein [Anaerolineales bacterium]
MNRPSPLIVDHVTDLNLRYPGEPLVLFTRVSTAETLPGYVLRVTLPAGLAIQGYVPPAQQEGLVPRIVRWPEGGQTVTWQVEETVEPEEQHEYRLLVQVERLDEPVTLVSRAFLEPANDEESRIEESTGIEVQTKSRYLRHLPALYDDDEFMGRFLMLFESFWTPIEGQIDQLPYLFDPKTTPPDLLPWLASWLNLVLDARWSESKRRKLIQSAVRLYRTRGTRRGLADYLEIYAGVRPQIVEHRARNLILGQEARLGQGVALGTRNAPHTFTVTLSLPDMEDEEAAVRRRTLEQIIEAEKPAHTAYELIIDSTKS